MGEALIFLDFEILRFSNKF